jgi:hypothetical protein
MKLIRYGSMCVVDFDSFHFCRIYFIFIYYDYVVSKSNGRF